MPKCLPPTKKPDFRPNGECALRGLGLLLLGFAAGCGGSQAGSGDGDPSSAEAPPAEEEKSFHDMKQGERIAFMKKVVMPRMSEFFQAVDSERYASMDCATCHGSGARQGHFRMPSSDLPALDVTDGFAAHRAEAPGMTTFMMERVVPEMANLLGESPYDPQTGRGFGCFDCHEKK